MTKKTFENKIFVMTPIGVFDYPYVNEPDTKYKTEGLYHTKLKCLKGIKGLSDFLAQLDEIADSWFAECQAGAKKTINKAPVPITVEGEAIIIKAKLNASGVNKETKEVFYQQPKLWDKKGAEWDKDVKITHGSTGRVKIEVHGYNTATMGCGIALRLKEVQVSSLKEYEDTKGKTMAIEDDGATEGTPSTAPEAIDESADF